MSARWTLVDAHRCTACGHLDETRDGIMAHLRDHDLDGTRESFDPKRDFPPEGATVETSEGTATFRDGTLPGWHLPDGRLCRPFSQAGLMLGIAWKHA